MNNESADSSSPSRGPGSGARSSRLHPMDWAIEAKAVDEIWQQTQLKVRRRQRRRRQVAAGSLVVALVAAGILWRGWRDGHQPSGAAHETMAATRSAVLMPEQRLLADGSKIDLKPGATLRVAYSQTARTVVLLQGEAHFEVMKDPRRPFVVQVGGVEVRAVGTAFSVQLETRQVEVLVTEGRVAVERSTEPAGGAAAGRPAAPPVAFLDAGTKLVVPADLPPATPLEIKPITSEQVATELAWRGKRVELSGTPLAEAVELFNRHNRLQLAVADPSLARHQLSGIFWADDAEGFVRLLEAGMGVSAERAADTIVLRRK